MKSNLSPLSQVCAQDQIYFLTSWWIANREWSFYDSDLRRVHGRSSLFIQYTTSGVLWFLFILADWCDRWIGNPTSETRNRSWTLSDQIEIIGMYTRFISRWWLFIAFNPHDRLYIKLILALRILMQRIKNIFWSSEIMKCGWRKILNTRDHLKAADHSNFLDLAATEGECLLKSSFSKSHNWEKVWDIAFIDDHLTKTEQEINIIVDRPAETYREMIFNDTHPVKTGGKRNIFDNHSGAVIVKNFLFLHNHVGDAN